MSDKANFSYSKPFEGAVLDSTYTAGDSTTYGAYYNFFTTNAGTSTSDYTTAGYDFEYNICPKSWTVPSKTEADTLKSNESASNFAGAKNGYYHVTNKNFSGAGSTGFYRTRTIYTTKGTDSRSKYCAYYMTSTASALTVKGQNNYFYVEGYAVRCLAK